MPLWDWDYAFDILPDLLRALVTTIEITLLASAVALVLGLLIAIVRRTRIPVVDQLVWALVEFIRSTPLLVQIFFLFFVLPHFGITLSALVVGCLRSGCITRPTPQRCTALESRRSRPASGRRLPH